MSYPLSSTVSGGDATLASQYNNLRSDAIYLGQSADSAVTLQALLERYESRLKLQRLGLNGLRVEASAASPVSLMIDGFMLQAVANVDLDEEKKPSGSASIYYVFANRSSGQTSFTLSVSYSSTEAEGQRRIGCFYWDGSKIVKDSVRTELALHVAELLHFVEPQVCEGRLTLSTGVAVSSGDVSSSTNVYFTPYLGSRVALYVPNYGWRVYPFSELSISIGEIAADKNADIFLYDNEGVLALSLVEWSNDTLRATALTHLDGVLVLSGSPTHRYLGTVRTCAAGVTCDTKLKRFVWNHYHRVDRPLLVTETAESWTYAASGVWRALNNSNSNRVEFVIGVDETVVKLSAHVLAENSGNNCICVGICLDNSNRNDAGIIRGIKLRGSTYNYDWYGSDYSNYPGLGYHFLQLTEYSGGGTTTFYGDRGSSEIQSGAIGSIIL